MTPTGVIVEICLGNRGHLAWNDLTAVIIMDKLLGKRINSNGEYCNEGSYDRNGVSGIRKKRQLQRP